ncbi:MAG: HD domain-containing protein [Deltaproteobacteria bacterium]|nr:HD domain-containing protein [Deltaproteobacteria bacterium]
MIPDTPRARATEIRDPLHGAIRVTPRERAMLDHPLFQRLRHIKQLGFSDLSFPGATHTRYLHSIGALHLAGRAFDVVFSGDVGRTVSPERRAVLRDMVRTAALLHDVGHAPFSHASEYAMPPLAELAVPVYAESPELYPPTRQATHEDYTIKVITDSSLTRLVEGGGDFPARAVAGLVDPRLPVDSSWYRGGGIDWRPLLQQLISSELDVDRMDYLGRDSHFAGVHYGVFDVDWLVSNLAPHVRGGRAWLGLSDRAIYAFDDFLIARYHMFLMVYFHYRSVAYEQMLHRFFHAGGDGWAFPTNIEDYAFVDDATLFAHLRRSRDPWARRIVTRQEYKLLLERHGSPEDIDLSPIKERLDHAGVPNFVTQSKGELSKYFAHRKAAGGTQWTLPLGEVHADDQLPTAPIYVLRQRYRGAPDPEVTELEDSTNLFERYESQLRMTRVYVPPDCVERAGKLIDRIA